MVKPSIKQLENLLALKRHERLGDAYWHDFLCEFHQRQGERTVKKSGIMHFLGHLPAWLSDLSSSKWIYGIGLVYAIITAVILLTNSAAEKINMPVMPVNFQVIPAAAGVEPLD